MRVSEIRVNQIRVNQGLGVLSHLKKKLSLKITSKQTVFVFLNFFTAFEEEMKLPKRKITKLKQIHITEVIEGEIAPCQKSQKKLNMMLFVAWNWLKLFQQF